MVSAIGIYMLGAFALDMVFTYRFLNLYRNRFPDKDWTASEANLIIRTCVKQFGLNAGMVVASLIIFIILGLIVYFTPENVRYFIGGIYSMALVFHFINFNALKRLATREVKK